MKKKFFVSIVCVVCAAACAFGLAACGGHDHDFAQQYTYNSEYHWRQCSRCKDKLDYSKHSGDGDVCGVCGYKFDQGIVGDDDGDSAFGNATVSANGVLSWNKIKGASKYVLKITYAAESDQIEYDIDGNQTSANLNQLRAEGFPAGKSSVEIVAYENAQVTIGGQTEYQEVPMTDVMQSFRIVKSNGSFSLVRLSYADDNIRLDGFYAEKQTIDEKSVYLYEQVLKDNQPMTFKINNVVKATSGHTVHFYKSAAGRDSGNADDIWNSFELQMGYPQVQHGANFYYVKVTDNGTGDAQDYDLCVYGIYSVTIQRFNTEFYESYDGLRTYTRTPIGNALQFNEMDVVPQEVLYGGVGEGKLGRSSSYEILEKQDITLVSDSTEIKYYFYDEEDVQSDCREYEQWSQTYYLSEINDGWRIVCKQSVTGIVNLPNAIIGTKVVSADYSYCTLSALVVEEGATTLVASFTDCWQLLNIFLPDTITEMRKNSFAGVNTEVTVNCAFTSDKASDFTLYWDYGVNKKVKTAYGVPVPNNALAIESGLVFVAADNADEASVTAAIGGFDGTIPATVTVGDKTYNVTRIDGIGNVQSLTIGESIKEIADGALLGVSSVTVASGSQYFKLDGDILYSKNGTRLLRVFGGSQITEFTVDWQVRSIDLGALSDLTSLQSLTVPFVGASASGTQNKHIGYIFGTQSSYDNRAFVPTTLRSVAITGGGAIGESAFSDCIGIHEVTIFGDITAIGNSAFFSCNGLFGVTIQSAVTTIGDGAFSGCQALANIELPDSLLSIGDSAFAGCITLESVTIPYGVKSIGYKAFSDCYNLATITVADSVEQIESEAFNGTAWFYNQPNGLIYAGKVALYHKGSLSSGSAIVLEQGTTGIADGAFNGRNELVSITIPESVAYIGYGALSYCRNLTDITFNGTKAQWNAIKIVDDIGGCTIHCTDGDIAAN
ncbi:MAG: leucine-rich repeat domain-containing protein [Clostridiales bacterium]|nr:leucine-rich repeat domain-containing protein [Clostridiales bacterium]